MVRNEGHAYTEVISNVLWYTGTLGVGGAARYIMGMLSGAQTSGCLYR